MSVHEAVQGVRHYVPSTPFWDRNVNNLTNLPTSPITSLKNRNPYVHSEPASIT